MIHHFEQQAPQHNFCWMFLISTFFNSRHCIDLVIIDSSLWRTTSFTTKSARNIFVSCIVSCNTIFMNGVESIKYSIEVMTVLLYVCQYLASVWTLWVLITAAHMTFSKVHPNFLSWGLQIMRHYANQADKCVPHTFCIITVLQEWWPWLFILAFLGNPHTIFTKRRKEKNLIGVKPKYRLVLIKKLQCACTTLPSDNWFFWFMTWTFWGDP